ncbi:MAG TPA: DUF2336 domain-containing protein [Xanthobacteraceae bacterium]|nr:DUF2336 domain-containing protein [Xanthobacteraceae bacterium]
MPPVEDNERAAAILERQAQGLLALDEALAELADANCVVTIAAVMAERIRVQADIVARFLDAESDEQISVICRAAGFSLNGFSALLRMRRRRNHGSRGATEALAYFSSLNRASAERVLQQMVPRPARPGRRFR